MADGGKDESTVGREAEESTIERTEHPSTRCDAVGALHAETALDSISDGAFFIGLALPWVTLDKVAAKATAAAGALTIPEQLLGLQERRNREDKTTGSCDFSRDEAHNASCLQEADLVQEQKN